MHVCPELGQFESLRSLLPEAVIHGADDIGFAAARAIRARCKPGDLFVAIHGEKFDGLNFVAEAVDRGCAGVLSDRTNRRLSHSHRSRSQRPGGLRHACARIWRAIPAN